jgi:hypothetical protein
MTRRLARNPSRAQSLLTEGEKRLVSKSLFDETETPGEESEAEGSIRGDYGEAAQIGCRQEIQLEPEFHLGGKAHIDARVQYIRRSCRRPSGNEEERSEETGLRRHSSLPR